MLNEFLTKMKEAGYGAVAISVRDPRIPFTEKLQVGTWIGYDNPRSPFHFVCADKDLRDKDGWPVVWSIARKMSLVIGGNGFGQAINIGEDVLPSGFHVL